MLVREPWHHGYREVVPSDKKRAWRLVRELVALIGRIPESKRGGLEGILLVLEKYVDDARTTCTRG